MENPFRKFKERLPINAVQEVGRDPLRVPLDTPPGDTVETARKLGAARELLMTVLPRPSTVSSTVDSDKI